MRTFVLADWNLRTMNLDPKSQILSPGKGEVRMDSKDQQGVIGNKQMKITTKEEQHLDADNAKISDHPTMLIEFTDAKVDRINTTILIEKTPRKKLSRQIILRFLDEQKLIDISHIEVRTKTLKTGFKTYKDSIARCILSTVGSVRQDLIAYAIFNKLFGKEDSGYVGEASSQIAEEYERIINPHGEEYEKQRQYDITQRMRLIDTVNTIQENKYGQHTRLVTPQLWMPLEFVLNQ